MGPRADAPAQADEPGYGPRITDPGLLRWLGGISAFVLVGFVTHGITHMPAAVPALLGATAALVVQDVRYLRAARPSHEERQHGILHVLEKEIEWPTLTFFAFLFILVGAAVGTGLIETLAGALREGITAGSTAMGLGERGTLIFAALLVCWVAGVLSALMDNIPFVAVSIPIIASLVAALPGDATALWWALSLGACLGERIADRRVGECDDAGDGRASGDPHLVPGVRGRRGARDGVHPRGVVGVPRRVRRSRA